MRYLITGYDPEQRRIVTNLTKNALEISELCGLDEYLTPDSKENYTLVYIANDESVHDENYIAFEKKLDDIKEFPTCVTSITTLPLDTNLEKQAASLNERMVLHNATVKMMRECAEYGIIQIDKSSGVEEIIVSHETDSGTKVFRYILDRFADFLLAKEQSNDFALLVQQLLYAKELNRVKE